MKKESLLVINPFENPPKLTRIITIAIICQFPTEGSNFVSNRLNVISSHKFQPTLRGTTQFERMFNENLIPVAFLFESDRKTPTKRLYILCFKLGFSWIFTHLYSQAGWICSKHPINFSKHAKIVSIWNIIFVHFSHLSTDDFRNKMFI